MPFQSEKQRRYLWANEPEIARDWTDTYGSRIDKNSGGIARLGLFDGSEINKGIAELEGTPINYLNANQVIPKSGISNLISGYDPAFGEVETWDSWNTGYPSGYFNKHSSYDWEGEHPQMIRYDEPGRFELSEEGEPTGINQLPNDFNRDYQPEDANRRTRLRNKGSGTKRAFMSGLGRIIDLPLGIMSSIAQGFPNNAQEQAMVDLYGGNTVTEGPMAGYNAASMFGKGLPAATQKRISKREETLQKMANWEQWRKDRFKQKTGILKAELAKQQQALQAQANKIPTKYYRQAQDPGGQSVANFKSTSPGGISQATSQAARTDQSGNQMSGWKW